MSSVLSILWMIYSVATLYFMYANSRMTSGVTQCLEYTGSTQRACLNAEDGTGASMCLTRWYWFSSCQNSGLKSRSKMNVAFHIFLFHGIFYSDFFKKRPMMPSNAWQGQKPYKQPLRGQCMELWRCRYNGNSRIWKTFRLGTFPESSRAVNIIEMRSRV